MALGFHRPFPALIQRRIPSSRDFSVLDGLRFRDRATFNRETLVKQFVVSGGKQLPFNCAMLNEQAAEHEVCDELQILSTLSETRAAHHSQE